MSKQCIMEVTENRPLAKDVQRMVIKGDTSAIKAPGQFVNVLVEGVYLRRPLSICEYDEQTITLVYRTLGSGTESLSSYEPGRELNILVGLGNGYTIPDGVKSPLLVAGGLGTPPMFALSKLLVSRSITPTVLLGFKSASDVFYFDRFTKLGCKTLLTTADGSLGQKGFVVDLIPPLEGQYDYFYSCGPEPMLKSVSDACSTSGQMSFEERMGCGFGACMGCTCKTKYGNKRICVDGPVLTKEEVIW